MAERQHIGDGLPDFLVRQRAPPRRHAPTAGDPAVGYGREHIRRIEVAEVSEPDAAIAVSAVAIRALPILEKLLFGLDDRGVAEVRTGSDAAARATATAAIAAANEKMPGRPARRPPPASSRCPEAVMFTRP
jgi:hypothetical protein